MPMNSLLVNSYISPHVVVDVSVVYHTVVTSFLVSGFQVSENLKTSQN